MALPRLRRPRGTAEVVSAAVVVVAVLVLALRMLVAAAGALVQAWPVLPALVLLVGAVGVRRLRQASTRRRREAERVAALRITLVEFDAMDDRHFEHALRDLLVRDDCTARRSEVPGTRPPMSSGTIHGSAGSWCRPNTPASAGRRAPR